MEITDIKEQLSIKTVLSHYNLEVNQTHQLCCPFHDDKTPSLKIYPETNTYNCFGCGANGDVIQFIQDKENLTKHKALKKAAQLTNLENVVPKASSLTPKNKSLPFGTYLEEAFKKMQQHLHRSKKAAAYLQDRCISDLTLAQGFNSTHYPKLKNCIIYPLKNGDDKIVSFYGRSITQKGSHYYLENRQGLYPNYPKPTTKTLLLTESIIDAATIQKYYSNHMESVEVLALYGINGLTQEHTEAVSQLPNLEEIIFFFDGDQAGRKATIALGSRLRDVMHHITYSSVNTPDNEDVNSLVQNNKPEILDYLIKKREVFYLYAHPF